MKKSLFTIAMIAIASGLIIITTSSKERKCTTSSTQGFVVMELFTSQGCSSCPPADDILGKYVEQNNEHIIPIAFHVDYWNRLGWKDPFSNNLYSQRQKDYADKFNLSSVYTPQLIINGEKEMVGSNEEEIKEAVATALNERPEVSINNESHTITNELVQVKYTIDGSLANTSATSLLIQHKTITKVRAGENNGVTLVNYNVVRSFTSSPAKQSASSSLQLPANVNEHDFSLVIITQNITSGKITGAFIQKL